ncbi:phenylacetaldoxime dehydratase family protein [Maribacter algarum]|uniref:Phenylacetaldoxime dehydratase family protein n=1 Tax=Maribacter algarum (ex Zhang et al. 2020) TaxID=2578118 RepID=A0A5S3PMW8_9FLAO|nr:phenylacetaldoxime dehydratase family protein [Maribacter algarum]TMM55814.1 phenylacetaldoxime dehydratase family protein [Maribacter algarum]
MEKYKKNMPPDWEPPVPAWSAQIEKDCTEVVIEYIGVQTLTDNSQKPTAFHNWYAGMMKTEHAPIHTERGRMLDSENYVNDFYISYWNSKEDYENYRSSSEFMDWWGTEERTRETSGYWLEPMIVPTERFETLFSSEDKAGAATIFNDFKGPIKEHNYFGGMRDRLEISEVNLLEGNGSELTKRSKIESLGKRVHLKTPENLAIIRSAQNLGHCKQEELDYYYKDVHPHLLKGMDFIATNPKETGCACSRFSDELTLDGNSTQKTFGFAYFLTLEHLEKWSKTHPTHLAIFHSFLEMVQSLEGQVAIKLWHEVSVLPKGQTFEYINCHPKTGLLPWFN